MNQSPAFMLQTRLQAIEFMLIHEASLINADCHRQLAYWPGQKDAVYGRRLYEMERLFAWCDYLRAKAGNEFSSLPPQDHLQEPEGECLPRSRQRWFAMLGEVLDEDMDPLMHHIIDMMAAFMLWSIVGGAADLTYRDRLVSEMKKRLKPLPEGASTSGRDVITTAHALKPKPKPRKA